MSCTPNCLPASCHCSLNPQIRVPASITCESTFSPDQCPTCSVQITENPCTALGDVAVCEQLNCCWSGCPKNSCTCSSNSAAFWISFGVLCLIIAVLGISIAYQ